ncbi:MAG: hypothetical protein GKR91_07325 [Pseudomonadales bacterium]|nr:hypothetical protein [Pseudomonadales bacterium]
MDDSLQLQYMILGSLLLFGLLSAKLVSFLKKRKNNVALWCTIFEYVSMGLVNLDMYKEPETRIEKKVKRDGENDPPIDVIDPKSLPKFDKY